MPNDIEQLDIHLHDVNGEHIVRLGEAAKMYDPSPYHLKGTIDTPAIFATVRKNEIDAKTTIIVANFKNRTITLHLFDDKPWKSSVKGTLDLHEELKSMGINATNKRYDNADLFNMLKFKAPYFVDRGQHARILSNLKAFDARIETLIQDKDNLKGSVLKQKAQEISSNMDLSFEIRLPVFSHQILEIDGEKWPSFIIDVNVSTDGNKPIFQLESESLYHYIRAETEDTFQKELEKFGGLFPIIKTFEGADVQ